MVSRKLDSLLRAHVASSRGVNAFSSSAGGEFGRPLLVILDRNVDLVPMLSHSWTYQALVNDVLGMKLNRVTVEVRFFFLALSLSFFPRRLSTRQRMKFLSVSGR